MTDPVVKKGRVEFDNDHSMTVRMGNQFFSLYFRIFPSGASGVMQFELKDKFPWNDREGEKK